MKIRITIPSIFSFFILTCWPITTNGQAPADSLLLDEQALKKVKVYNDLYSAFKKPDEVVILDLRGQKLNQLPDSIDKFNNLQLLRLGCKIKDSTPKRIIRKSKRIGGGIMHLDRMQGKYIAYNFLTKLPVTIKNLTKLQEIDLAYNNLSDVPVELAELKNLKKVNLIGNYKLLDKSDQLKMIKKSLPTDCKLWTDLRID
jgi:Leucine-rich repeat (LRR) protein